jgi:hypothetical protein
LCKSRKVATSEAMQKIPIETPAKSSAPPVIDATLRNSKRMRTGRDRG